MSKNEKTRTIPAKNYVILACLFLGTILLLMFITNKYEQIIEFEKQTPVISDTLHEITPTEVEHYVTENPTTVMYMCTSSDDVCRSYEKKLKKFVIDKDLTDDIIYVNLSDVDVNQFVDEFNNKFPYSKELTTTYPAFVIMEDNKVEAILQGSKDKPLSISRTEDFFDYYEVGKELE